MCEINISKSEGIVNHKYAMAPSSLYQYSQLDNNSGKVKLASSSVVIKPVMLVSGGILDLVTLASQTAVNYALRIWVVTEILGSDGGKFFHIKDRAGIVSPGYQYPIANALRMYDILSVPIPEGQPYYGLLPDTQYFINILNLTNESVDFSYMLYDVRTGEIVP